MFVYLYLQDPKADPQQLINKKAEHPHIICVYAKAENKAKYYIAVSQFLMNVS